MKIKFVVLIFSLFLVNEIFAQNYRVVKIRGKITLKNGTALNIGSTFSAADEVIYSQGAKMKLSCSDGGIFISPKESVNTSIYYIIKKQLQSCKSYFEVRGKIGSNGTESPLDADNLGTLRVYVVGKTYAVNVNKQLGGKCYFMFSDGTKLPIANGGKGFSINRTHRSGDLYLFENGKSRKVGYLDIKLDDETVKAEIKQIVTFGQKEKRPFEAIWKDVFTYLYDESNGYIPDEKNLQEWIRANGFNK